MSVPLFYGYTIFCDDIRRELGGKISFMGVYQSQMYIHGDFPFTLPKFALAIRYFEKKGSCTHDVQINIFMPGDDLRPAIEGKFPMQELRNAPSPPGPPSEYIQVGAEIMMSAIVIKASGVLRVEAKCEAETVSLGALQILRAPKRTSATASPPPS